MQVIVRSVYGSPDVLRLEEVPTPVPAEGQVLVRIRAASLNRADLDYLTGQPFLTRALIGLPKPRIHRVGLDAAGEVEALGPGVTRFKVGDRVFADLTQHGHGAFAEYACVRETAWRPIPDGLDFETAATLPQSGLLALQGLGRSSGVRPGDQVLINGASGCIGPFAVQLAKAAGAEVTGTCSAEKMEFVRSLGADHVLDYRVVDYTRGSVRYDRILDAPGNRSVFAARRALKPRGTYVSFGGTSSGRLFSTVFGGMLLSVGRRRSLGMLLAWKPNDAADLASLAAMVQAGTLVSVTDRRFPLAEVPDALRYLAAGKARGKVVITI